MNAVPTVETTTVPTEMAPEPTTVVATPVPATAIPATAAPTDQPSDEQDVVNVDSDGNTTVDLSSLNSALNQAGFAVLSDEEVQDLLHMREEEKLAHDVYLTLYEQWRLPVFQNIANSELTHTSAVQTLLMRYDVEDPALNNGVGVFSDEGLQALYAQLVAQGSQSLPAALQVGATIEDLDIVDLEDAVARTDNRDISLVYSNLMKGSRNHLRAFISTLQKHGGEPYQPQYLDQAAFEAIINSPMERGRRGR
jgi:hypothetical protein